MKLTGASAKAYLGKPDPGHAGILIFGADAMRVAGHRQEVIAKLVGPTGEEEMRLTRISGADLRKDPALLDDALKSQGFFPGHKVAYVEEASDGLAKLFDAALQGWEPEDAQVVVTAGQLTAKSALRKIFESHGNAVAIGIYDDPMTVQDVEQTLAHAGIRSPENDVMQALMGLAQSLEPGDFRQTVDKISLFKRGDDNPLSTDDIKACAPQSAEADLDDVLDIVTTGQANALAPVLRSLYAQGVTPVTLCIGATRHFRRLHTVASDPGGAHSGIARLRPPVFGPRRDKIINQVNQWGRDGLERALTALTDTDLQLRSASLAPQAAIMERTLIRLAMMARR